MNVRTSFFGTLDDIVSLKNVTCLLQLKKYATINAPLVKMSQYKRNTYVHIKISDTLKRAFLPHKFLYFLGLVLITVAM